MRMKKKSFLACQAPSFKQIYKCNFNHGFCNVQGMYSQNFLKYVSSQDSKIHFLVLTFSEKRFKMINYSLKNVFQKRFVTKNYEKVPIKMLCVCPS
jgi:hypothetical protein